ncbi:4'-phosphopantetheinyl transferase EntD (siderophore biosynthesis) [Roseateles sp. YR242]|uniref:4'-phosphopantetheinyl transferase family protein n=1 Tax=Roseateles sp. YR242 TaxID=1855305 RepID=UPI0008B1D3A7|nr:4'-phosphopantetheinyl transferase superfamily protein [Roseateles sp. YR242]SEL86072.1 4'-phosphopantetheinyl transferase EntD (siderophore biosynthesis) [Roseateles sp. YR242]
MSGSRSGLPPYGPLQSGSEAQPCMAGRALPSPTQCILTQGVLPLPAHWVSAPRADLTADPAGDPSAHSAAESAGCLATTSTATSTIHSCLLQLREDVPFDIGQFKAAGMAIPETIARSVPKRQAEFFHGRWAARCVLHQAQDTTGGPDWNLPIGKSREPLWPAGMVGSLTHCEGFAAAAVARVSALRALGIDIERVATGDNLEALRTTTLDAAERRLLESHDNTLPVPVLITLAFSAKESLFKAAFPSVQRYFDFDAARVVELAPSERRLVLQLTERLSPDLQPGSRITAHYALLQPAVVFTHVSW